MTAKHEGEESMPTTIRLRSSVRQRLAEMASATGLTQQQILEAALGDKLNQIEREGKITIEVALPSQKGSKRPSAAVTTDKLLRKPTE